MSTCRVVGFFFLINCSVLLKLDLADNTQVRRRHQRRKQMGWTQRLSLLLCFGITTLSEKQHCFYLGMNLSCWTWSRAEKWCCASEGHSTFFSFCLGHMFVPWFVVPCVGSDWWLVINAGVTAFVRSWQINLIWAAGADVPAVRWHRINFFLGAERYLCMPCCCWL